MSNVYAKSLQRMIAILKLQEGPHIVSAMRPNILLLLDV